MEHEIDADQWGQLGREMSAFLEEAVDRGKQDQRGRLLKATQQVDVAGSLSQQLRGSLWPVPF